MHLEGPTSPDVGLALKSIAELKLSLSLLALSHQYWVIDVFDIPPSSSPLRVFTALPGRLCNVNSSVSDDGACDGKTEGGP
ncbi:hypothetical protein EYF80_056626 [Liparis tanakae]|uniref:Uncharacterized protein n=1 Tax=Liparis tanakae TaxID=230148 RepID=A0A4Z2EX66_9TELE|nr:hypothetical protein EYF80_056626 [Liparis tanakae]